MLLLARPYRSSGNVQILILSIVALINVLQYLSVTIFLSSNTYECFATLINVYSNSVKKIKKVEYRQYHSKTTLLQGHEANYNVSYGTEILPAYHNIIVLTTEKRRLTYRQHVLRWKKKKG